MLRALAAAAKITVPATFILGERDMMTPARAGQALAAAQENWRVQREPDDVLILLRAAEAAHRPEVAAPVLEFLRREKLEDARLTPYLASAR